MEFSGAGAPSGRKRILIVEDEQFVALALEGMLSDLGFDVLGTVADVSTALALIAREEIGGVILDVKLGRERCDPVADLLAQRACPFFFVTGCDVSELPERHAGCTVLQKPFGLDQLLPALRENFGFQSSEHSGFGMQSKPADNRSLIPAAGPPSVPPGAF
ncbi:MAG TPA: response regulator [Methylocella sp.]|nr:response regulator [Methylocella sp.]